VFFGLWCCWIWFSVLVFDHPITRLATQLQNFKISVGQTGVKAKHEVPTETISCSSRLQGPGRKLSGAETMDLQRKDQDHQDAGRTSPDSRNGD
jgi:hypothetical protein